VLISVIVVAVSGCPASWGLLAPDPTRRNRSVALLRAAVSSRTIGSTIVSVGERVGPEQLMSGPTRLPGRRGRSSGLAGSHGHMHSNVADPDPALVTRAWAGQHQQIVAAAPVVCPSHSAGERRPAARALAWLDNHGR